jgi:hypothetical protein
MPEDHKQPPKTIEGVGIHIEYLREDISELKELLTAQALNSASKADVAAHDVRISKLEEIVEKVEARIVGAAITIFVLMVLAMYGLDKYFK